ncbi:Uncharacterized protein APZ42_033316 [Daphnia magna]|uniref:Uncharacterized protein n=1 Tax=Daphnia magna TaxID=35525 RepID=A0A164L896_9CRUS|nr:Uncharacterized protein APZ42_033316 [Daphnia magna]
MVCVTQSEEEKRVPHLFLTYWQRCVCSPHAANTARVRVWNLNL